MVIQHYLYFVPATLEGLDREQEEMWSDVQGRSEMAANLILDKAPGMLSRLPGIGEKPKMGKEVEDAAKALLEYNFPLAGAAPIQDSGDANERNLWW